MATILLIIIYMAFISLGLPDSILGSAWPMIYGDLHVPVSYAGIATMVVTGGTVISSMLSEKLIRRFGTGVLSACSVFLTAAGLLGISISPGFVWLCLLGIPLGLGAGAIDAALNNFVALHYEAKHMNWLHCFWGIGATAGPLLMSMFLVKEHGWKMGYAAIGIIQTVMFISLAVTLPLWKKVEKSEEAEIIPEAIKLKSVFKLAGAKPAFVAFFCYCGTELTIGLWGSTYLVESRGITAELAARWTSLYYLGITAGRLAAGFIAIKINNRTMIRLGQFISILGILLLLIPSYEQIQAIGFMVTGLGLAPIYPAMLHETPNRFGKEVSQGIMGFQMASAYIGNTLMPPVFGMLAKSMGFSLLPYFMMGLVILMLLFSERVTKVTFRS